MSAMTTVMGSVAASPRQSNQNIFSRTGVEREEEMKIIAEVGATISASGPQLGSLAGETRRPGTEQTRETLPFQRY